VSEDEPEVLLRRDGALARITLNRPKAINALNLAMVREITPALREWADDDGVATVLLDGAGERGLCAGGDIVTLHDAARSNEHGPAYDFWREEYELDALIARFPKPFAVIMNGIVMGGGVGLAAHAAHRLATETLAFAMPEVGIGFAPDVGGTWLLSRAPGELGTHLALTGERIGAADAILCGFADRAVGPGAHAELLARLPGEDLAAVLADLAEPDLEEAKLPSKREWVDASYSADSVEEILERLRARPEPEAAKAVAAIAAKSPTSLKIALRALREARELPGLEACLERELVTSLAFLDWPDFVEGVRSTVIDKDRDPHWNPPTLERVTPEMLEPFFAAPAERIGATR